MKVLKRHIEKSFMSSLTVFVLTVGVRCGGGGRANKCFINKGNVK
jgi:hypothetical protein